MSFQQKFPISHTAYAEDEYTCESVDGFLVLHQPWCFGFCDHTGRLLRSYKIQHVTEVYTSFRTISMRVHGKQSLLRIHFVDSLTQEAFQKAWEQHCLNLYQPQDQEVKYLACIGYRLHMMAQSLKPTT